MVLGCSSSGFGMWQLWPKDVQFCFRKAENSRKKDFLRKIFRRSYYRVPKLHFRNIIFFLLETPFKLNPEKIIILSRKWNHNHIGRTKFIKYLQIICKMCLRCNNFLMFKVALDRISKLVQKLPSNFCSRNKKQKTSINMDA